MKPHEEKNLTKEEMVDLNPAILRPIQKWVTGEWVDCRLKDLKPFDEFRYQDNPTQKYTALEKPYVNDFYVWSIKARIMEIKDIVEE
jgi:hypothetical protein